MSEREISEGLTSMEHAIAQHLHKEKGRANPKTRDDLHQEAHQRFEKTASKTEKRSKRKKSKEVVPAEPAEKAIAEKPDEETMEVNAGGEGLVRAKILRKAPGINEAIQKTLEELRADKTLLATVETEKEKINLAKIPEGNEIGKAWNAIDRQSKASIGTQLLEAGRLLRLYEKSRDEAVTNLDKQYAEQKILILKERIDNLNDGLGKEFENAHTQDLQQRVRAGKAKHAKWKAENKPAFFSAEDMAAGEKQTAIQATKEWVEMAGKKGMPQNLGGKKETADTVPVGMQFGPKPEGPELITGEMEAVLRKLKLIREAVSEAKDLADIQSVANLFSHLESEVAEKFNLKKPTDETKKIVEEMDQTRQLLEAKKKELEYIPGSEPSEAEVAEFSEFASEQFDQEARKFYQAQGQSAKDISLLMQTDGYEAQRKAFVAQQVENFGKGEI